MLLSLGESATNGVEQAIYSAPDESLHLVVEYIPCDQARRTAVFNNILHYVNTLISSNATGRFIDVSDIEMQAEWMDGHIRQRMVVTMLPASVQIWTFRTVEGEAFQLYSRIQTLQACADRQRYTDALAAGNVAMGQWRSSIYDYASQLVERRHRKEGLAVLRKLLATSPFDYEAHTLFYEQTGNPAAASNSAAIVFNNAETGRLIDQAAHFLGKPHPLLKDIPMLDANERGLQLILVPLAPCDLWLLEDAAVTYQQITGIPTKIRRLRDDWTWDRADRMARQRVAQDVLVRQAKKNIDFSGWKRRQYIDALRNAEKVQNALSCYYIEQLIADMEHEPGQYNASPVLDQFCDALSSVRSADARILYVGLTGANIYSGDHNYVFSLGNTGEDCHASILSYHMMLGENTGNEYESRQRLVERMAKELVPASLKQLGIPRSTDPACPYSYSSGVTRMDQKTLHLSDGVRKALDAFR